MNFLAIDTSGRRLVVAAHANGKTVLRNVDCPMRHSVLLMGEIEGALAELGVPLRGLDAVACVVGPGSFTGIRIGISTVKGLCFGADKPAIPVTSFDCLAYAVEERNTVALVDAGHGAVYARGFGDFEFLTEGYYTAEEVLSKGAGACFLSAEPLAVSTRIVDPAAGLLKFIEARGEKTPAASLAALYLRRSQAEEKA